MRKKNKCISLIFAFCLAIGLIFSPLRTEAAGESDEKPKEIKLRVCNWEEYIDEGDWDEEETIEEKGKVISAIPLWKWLMRL